MPVTFVTAFIDLEEDRGQSKPSDFCFEKFKLLAEIDLPLVVFLSPKFQELWDAQIVPMNLKNIRMVPFGLKDLDLYHDLDNVKHDLPQNRLGQKDTKNYLILQSAKAEFIYRAMGLTASSPTTHYAWIDFNIFHVIKYNEITQEYLKSLSTAALPETCMQMPGCWAMGREKEKLFEKVNWRFCGGFFLGDRSSLRNFQNLSRNHFADVTGQKRILTWEVNLWHQYEMHQGFKPNWFAADHNDTIVRIPYDFMNK